MNDNILVFDTETTGLPRKGDNWESDFMNFPYIVELAWQFDGNIQDYIINQEGREVPAEATAIHGITTEQANASTWNLRAVMPLFLDDCLNADKIVGHNTYFDTSIIKANELRLARILADKAKSEKLFSVSKGLVIGALHKDKRVDTMKKTIKLCGLKQKDSNRAKFPSLAELYFKLFSETYPDTHRAGPDVLATRRCFDRLVEMGII